MYVFFVNVADHFVVCEVCDWTLSTTLDAPEKLILKLLHLLSVPDLREKRIQ
jgi:hypothetical protein